jgi:hypothetical protein
LKADIEYEIDVMNVLTSRPATKFENIAKSMFQRTPHPEMGAGPS